MNILTRSGSNLFHGNAFEFIRNDALDARNFFALQNPPFKRNQFGGSLGGPIVRDRTFFFANYEGTRIRQGITLTGVVPTAPQRTGNLSGFGKTLRDPINGGSFANGVIPDTRIDPISRRLLDYWPLPNNPGGLQNWIVSPSSRFDTDRAQVRIDHNLNNMHTLYGRYSFEDARSYTPGPFSEATKVGGAFDNPNYQNATLKLTSILNPGLINEFQVSYNKTQFQDLKGQNLGNPIARSSGLKTLIQPEDSSFEGFPENVGLSRTSVSGIGETQPSLNIPRDFGFGDKVNWTRGKHNFRFGGDLAVIRVRAAGGGHNNGNYTFNGTLTGDGFADFLLGWPSSFLNNIGPNRIQRYERLISAVFFVDDWKVNSRLTINWGVRYELETVPKERNGNVSIFDPTLIGPTGVRGGLAFPSQNSIAKSFFTDVRPDLPFKILDRETNFIGDHNNVAPRFGFGYRPFGGTKTVVRGGYGWYYSSPNVIQTLANIFSAPPGQLWPTAATDPNSPTLGWNSVSGISKPEELFKVLTFGLLTGSESHLLNGYTQQFSLTIDHELRPDLVLDMGYMGSKSTHLETSFDENYAPPSATPLRNKVPYPAWGRVSGWHNGSDATYHGLMTSAEKRFGKGLAFKGAWTWSHGMASRGARARSDRLGFAQNPGNLNAERGPVGNDARHRFVGYWVYELPFGPGKAVGLRDYSPRSSVDGT
ncbi:MAG: hypothetical protein DMG07_26080 [Acidobacteria bacterium]|nr:MAG: hypothetical protein DMG07_26080 [Acidobacteriota bacterium]